MQLLYTPIECRASRYLCYRHQFLSRKLHHIVPSLQTPAIKDSQVQADVQRADPGIYPDLIHE